MIDLKELQKAPHIGFPECSKGVSLGTEPKRYPKEWDETIKECDKKLIGFLGAKYGAVKMYYPKDGFLGWHNNANAAAFNLIFTWSEFGEGCFKYIHPVTKEEIICEDAAGAWTCKAAYFGHYGEQDKLLYHAAETDNWRCTVSYTFSTAQASEEFREMVIADISSAE